VAADGDTDIEPAGADRHGMKGMDMTDLTTLISDFVAQILTLVFQTVLTLLFPVSAF
jgi:hypothetical protein